jgi:hypothetical protein
VNGNYSLWSNPAWETTNLFAVASLSLFRLANLFRFDATGGKLFQELGEDFYRDRVLTSGESVV